MSARFASVGAEFAHLDEDLGEAVGEPVESGARVAGWQRAAEHQHRMLGGAQEVDDAVETFSLKCRRYFGLRRQMPGFGVGQPELALKISQGDIDVVHGHLRIGVSE